MTLVCSHQPTKERPDCSVDPCCSKCVGQSDVERVLCAGLQSHDVEGVAISHNLVGRVENAISVDLQVYGWIIWVDQVELYTSTAHWDVGRVQFSGWRGDTGSSYMKGRNHTEVV